MIKEKKTRYREDALKEDKFKEKTTGSFSKNKDKWRELCSFWRWYPDRFIDFISQPDSKISLYFYQRIYLRIMMRYRKVFITATRGTSKSYLQNLCFPIVTVIGLDQIHLLVAVDGLK